MSSLPLRRSLMMLAALALAGTAACDRGITDPADDHDDEHGAPAAAEVYDRATGERLAYTHGTGASIHWDGGLPHLHVGEEIALDVVFMDEDGNTIPLGGEFEVRARLADGAAEGIIEFENHVDHVDVEAVAQGETEIVFMLWHGGHSDWDSPPLTVEVEPDQEEAGEPVAVELRDRDTGELLAETHGTGEDIHWDGAIPELQVGSEIEIDVIFLDEHGHEIPLGGEYEVRARLADGAAEGIIEIENHGDHVDIDAVAEGETEIVFMFWHDDHADWETPAITVTVTSS